MYTLEDQHHVSDAPIEGYREGLAQALVAHCPSPTTGSKRVREFIAVKRAGYRDALYVLRAWTRPPAYLRAEPVTRLQRQIEHAIAVLEGQPETGIEHALCESARNR
jgi:hypothetical protein